MFAINVNKGLGIDAKDNFAGGPILAEQPDFIPAGNARSYDDSCVSLQFKGTWSPNTIWVKKWAPAGKYYKPVNANATGTAIADKYTYDLVTIPQAGATVAVAPVEDGTAATTASVVANQKGRYQDLEIISSGYKYDQGRTFWGETGKYVDYQVTKNVNNPIVGNDAEGDPYTVTLSMKGWQPAGKKYDANGELVDDSNFSFTANSLAAAKEQLIAGNTASIKFPDNTSYTIGKLRNAVGGANEPDDTYVDYVWNADAVHVEEEESEDDENEDQDQGNL